jgi:hypothetical protein
MKRKTEKESSEIFADFTMSRIDRHARESMTEQQLIAVRQALVANSPFNRHAVDIRGSIPLFFARFYFVVLAGRDRRRKTREKELRRIYKGNVPLGYFLSFIVLSFLIALIWMALIVALYWLKREMGIDIFPNIHLLDLFNHQDNA